MKSQPGAGRLCLVPIPIAIGISQASGPKKHAIRNNAGLSYLFSKNFTLG